MTAPETPPSTVTLRDAAVRDRMEVHDAALDGTLAMVARVPADAWEAPTPCTAWTVRAVVGHLIWGNAVLAAALLGEVYSEPAGGRTARFAAPYPDAHRASVEHLREILRSPAWLPDTVAFPTGPLPLTVALGFRVLDLVVHTWDIAVATATPLSPALATLLDAERTAQERAAAGTLDPRQFAPAAATPATSVLDRLLVRVGRDPAWHRP